MPNSLLCLPGNYPCGLHVSGGVGAIQGAQAHQYESCWYSPLQQKTASVFWLWQNILLRNTLLGGMCIFYSCTESVTISTACNSVINDFCLQCSVQQHNLRESPIISWRHVVTMRHFFSYYVAFCTLFWYEQTNVYSFYTDFVHTPHYSNLQLQV